MRSRDVTELVRDQRPLTLPPETPVHEAAATMHARRVGAVLVVENDRLVGIFTGRDALRCLARKTGDACTLRDAMTPAPHSLSPGTPAMDALRAMHDMGVRHMPLVDAGRVVGIVSRYDFRAMEHARLEEETGYFETIR